MAVLPALLMLVSFSSAYSNNHFHSETKLSVLLANKTNNNVALNVKKQMRINPCQNQTWLVESKSGDCECADSLDAVYCDRNTKEVFISSQYCMSYNRHLGEEVVGRCPYIYVSFYKLNFTNVGQYIKLPGNVTELEHLFCDRLNREGYFCSSCKNGYHFSMYPNFLKCVKCDPQHYTRNWALYVVITFIPLTAFLILVVCFRISATSAPMNAFIFVSQIISLPPFERQFYRTIDSTILPRGAKVFLHVLHSLYGLWNLDFFITLIHPFFCLPNLSIVNVISLAYITALYPLLVLIALYILIELHSANFRILVWLWKPFQLWYRRFQRRWDIQCSIIDAFATFFLLSYVKLLFISLDLFATSRVWSKHREVVELTAYFDANMKVYPGSPGNLALIISIFIIVCIPTLLLLLYPCCFCQKLLTRCSCLHFRFLRFLMESFLGSYTNGTNGTRDCRYFAFLFLIVRVTISVEYAVVYINFNFQIAVLLTCSLLAIVVAVAQPYNKKYAFFNRLDPLMIFFLVVWLTCFLCMQVTLGKYQRYQYRAVTILCLLSLGLPIVVMISYWLIRTTKKWYPSWKCSTHTDDDRWHQRPSSPYTPLYRPYGAIDNVVRDTTKS